ncbi:uncharacterized protein MONBRDRAFT_14613, partial [Monosiga brevicollis MX1]
RGFLARRQLASLRLKHQAYVEAMERLERDAWVAMVKRQQEQDARQLQLEREQRKLKQAQTLREKQLREAAFDGEVDDIISLLQQGVSAFRLQMLRSPDGNGDTALSEAAAGGHSEALALLLHRGARVNARGRFERTPLFRAAFAGHVEAVKLLLHHGADPRLYDNEGMPPPEVGDKAERRKPLSSTRPKRVELRACRLLNACLPLPL